MEIRDHEMSTPPPLPSAPSSIPAKKSQGKSKSWLQIAVGGIFVLLLIGWLVEDNGTPEGDTLEASLPDALAVAPTLASYTEASLKDREALWNA